jgi:cobalt-zinc-cadmium efflux system outer membrane protein
VDRGAAQLDAMTRTVLRDVAVSFYRVIHADQRIALLTTTETLAASIHQAADRQFRAGDIAVLDVNLARAALARVRSDRETARADREAAVASLRQWLQIGVEVQFQAELTSLPPVDRAELLELAHKRPEIRDLEAAIREAEADRQFAQTFSRPDFGLGISFKQEEGDRALGAAVRLTLPFFAKGQELQAVSTARASRLRAELEAARSRIQLELDVAIAVFDRRREAVQVLLTDALPGLDENEQLASRSFEAGQIGLPELLLIRREFLDTRFQYLNALLEAALARVDIDATAGVIR